MMEHPTWYFRNNDMTRNSQQIEATEIGQMETHIMKTIWIIKTTVNCSQVYRKQAATG